MLVLSRKRNEIVDVFTPSGERISIVIVEIRGDKIRLGVDAPPEFATHRREVADAIRRNGRGMHAGMSRRHQEKLLANDGRSIAMANMPPADPAVVRIAGAGPLVDSPAIGSLVVGEQSVEPQPATSHEVPEAMTSPANGAE